MQEKTKIWHELGRPNQKSLLLRILFEKQTNLTEAYYALYEDKFEQSLASGWDEVSPSGAWDACWFEGPSNGMGFEWDSKLVEPLAS